MKIHTASGDVLYTSSAPTIREAVEEAVREGYHLTWKRNQIS